jgi:hypothetical protein
VVTACVLAGSSVAAVLGAPGALIMMVLTTMVALMLIEGNHRRARALDRLAALPFPVEHDRESAIDTHGVNRSAIRGVTVRLADRLDRPALARAARDAQARAPRLAVIADDDTIEITGWYWGDDDLLLLVDLLCTWAHALHVDHAIAIVRVTWAPGGPVSI